MTSEATRVPARQPGRPCSFSLLLVLVAGLLGAPSAAAGQNPQLPSPSQAQQMLQQNPQLGEQIRQRLQQSGMTAEQVHSRLRAAGYPDSLLDAYLGPTSALQAGAMPGVLELTAIQSLGLAPIMLPGQSLTTDTGMVTVAAPTIPAESLAAGNYVFGVDVFRRSRTQFLPLLAGPVPPDYKLGVGDQLVLILTGDVELAYSLSVTREGFVLIPQVGQVFVNNLTLDQVREVFYSRLGRIYSGVKRAADATTRFDVSVANVRVNQVYVIGEVVQPGAYQISALGTVLTGLYAAGGITARANLRQIEVRRLGKAVDTLDLYDYLLRGDSRRDIRLATGDIVFVPVRGVRAQVTGAVTRPAIYELRPQETLSDLLRAAGGFRPDAALRRLAVYRILPPASRSPANPTRAVIDVPVTFDSSGAGTRDPEPGHPSDPTRDALRGVIVPSLGIEDGDSVVVDAIPVLAREYHVGIEGMVQKPGQYPWHLGMTLRDVVLLARGPVVGADLREAEIGRMPEDRSTGQLATTMRVPLDSSYLYNRDASGRYFGPPGLPFPGAGAPDVQLKPYDIVLILKQPEFDFQRTVTVTGQVRYPGVYSLRTKTDRLADIIQRTGGLTTQAYPEGIRFVRQVDGLGRINVDLPRALHDSTSRDNIILQPGDVIEIPEYQPAVKVNGAVNSPGSVLWQKGGSLEYYVNAAGGFSYKADKGKVSVKYANGAVRTKRKSLFVTSDPKPGPGSEVFVPTKETVQPTNWVVVITTVTSLLASTLAILVLVKQL
jgi:protein involved in polysaccharide export with SLBB domain